MKNKNIFLSDSRNKKTGNSIEERLVTSLPYYVNIRNSFILLAVSSVWPHHFAAEPLNSDEAREPSP